MWDWPLARERDAWSRKSSIGTPGKPRGHSAVESRASAVTMHPSFRAPARGRRLRLTSQTDALHRSARPSATRARRLRRQSPDAGPDWSQSRETGPSAGRHRGGPRPPTYRYRFGGERSPSHLRVSTQSSMLSCSQRGSPLGGRIGASGNTRCRLPTYTYMYRSSRSASQVRQAPFSS